MEQSQKRRRLIVLAVMAILWVLPVGARPRDIVQEHSPHEEKSDKKSEKTGLPEFKPQALGDLSSLLNASARAEAQKFLAATAAFQSGQNQNAVKILGDLSNFRFLFREAGWLKAQALWRADQGDDALAALGVIEKPVSLLDWQRFWLRLEILASQGQAVAVHSAVAHLPPKTQNDIGVAAKAGFYSGQATWLAGQKESGLAAFRKVLVQSPGTSADDLISRFLRAKGTTIESILGEPLLNLRAEKLIATGYAHRGRMIYERLRRESGGSSYDERLATAFFRERSYAEASRIFKSLLARSSGSERLSLMTNLATASARSDQTDQALAVNRQIIASFPSSSAASDARQKIPFLLFDAGRYADAANAFESPALKGSAKQKERARWYRFWSFYLTKQYAKARGEMALWPGRGARDGALTSAYWTARCLEKEGQKAQARAAYQRVADQNAGGYYGLLARERLHSGSALAKTLIPAELLSVSSGSTELSEPTRGLAATNEDLLRAAVLYRAGFDDLAYDATLKVGSSVLADQAAFLREAGNFHAAYANVGLARRGGVVGCGAACAESLSYPAAYAKYVVPSGAHWGVDPALVYGIMRQESAFKPVAQSFAYAKGLMQIIPPTADEIAADLGLKNFLADDYQEPRANVAFGAYYLSKLLRQFNGDPVLAIAAYNAGPDAVGRWSKRYGALPRDEFVELIAYKETGNYVRRVLLNMLTYKRMY